MSCYDLKKNPGKNMKRDEIQKIVRRVFKCSSRIERTFSHSYNVYTDKKKVSRKQVEKLSTLLYLKKVFLFCGYVSFEVRDKSPERNIQPAAQEGTAIQYDNLTNTHNMEPTYKEFAAYLREIAFIFDERGNVIMEPEHEFQEIYDALCQIHNDFDHGAKRIEELKRIFVEQTGDYGQGWTPTGPIRKQFTDEQLSFLKELITDALNKDIKAKEHENINEDLDMINIIQSNLREEQYNSAEQYLQSIPKEFKEGGEEL